MNGSDQFQQILRDLDKINLADILVTVGLAWLAIVLIQWLVPWIAGRLPGRLRFHLLPIVPVARLLILAIALWQVAILLIEPSPQNILAIVGTLAVALGFAFKDYVSSLIAGVVAIYERPYRPGDWVTIGGDYGEVRSVGLRAIQIVTPDDTVVHIPHSRLWTENIANANDGQREHLCVADFYIHPSHDAGQVRQVLRDVALTSPYTQLRRPITVIVREEPWGTHYRLKAYPLDGRDEFQYISDLTVRGKAALEELGLQPANVLPAVTATSPI
ncbi:mechanosensitive ion channel family protein [Litorilinea aerophila]|uniref:Mechanosensitive ion channel n=1 Tax=Litorilinea aerophila TaxID=1204385 RepID=A0A540VL38_9CHLR|nr:mechanosensitive ion channel domain-containing protein [Litorilinea aerophila]MCC9075169.1 mechanosensitive ion channel family protein [Litorilinea aerophila]OUC04947.1 mechanosensitive ion channel protein MscS [Litorilinea aerophila]GIV78175.1 MAG: mechanosensitive ion channel protein MscS [Litorilinea sp.]